MLTKAFYFRFIPAVSLVALTLAGGSAPAIPASAQEGRWSPPVPLSPEGQFAWFPDVVVDLTGQIHVVWSSAFVGYDVVMYTTSRNGQEWSQANDLMAFSQVAGTEATRPGVFVDQYNRVHMSFRHTSVYYAQAPAASAFSATAWTSPRVASGEQIAYASRVARDSQGTLHLIYTENVYSTNCPICYHVFYRCSDDNGERWSPPVDISRATTGAAKLQLLVDRQDNLHAVWESGRGGSYSRLEDPTRVVYAASYDRGETWSAPLGLDDGLSTPESNAKDITIGQSRDGQLVAAWLRLPEDQVYYRASTDQGRSWSMTQPIPDVWGGWSIYNARLDDYAMASDSAGNVHMVLVGRVSEEQTSLSLLHLIWNGVAWLEPEAILTMDGDAPEWPRIAVGNGQQLHVVWFVRDQANLFDPDNGQYRIWYVQGMAAAPEVAATIAPLPTPTQEPESTMKATLAPSPSPTTSWRPADNVDSTSTESDEVSLLLQSLIPSILLVGIIIIGTRLLRR
jgi:hypothetical protein